MTVQQSKTRKPPTGIQRLLWRAPIWMYRLKLGGLIKKRMLLLHHTGRVSGQPRQNVLEIVKRDEENDVYYLASGFGKQSDWYKNISKQPAISITVGREEKMVTAVPLPPEESAEMMVDYAHRNPKAAKELTKICGLTADGSDKDYATVGREYIPFVALKRRD